jgi:dTDP-4-amino-4,6-dideoxygalactose transaminase
MKYLLKKGITTQVHYIPIPLHPFYSNSGHKMQKLRNATEYYKKALSIPIFFNLSEKDQKKIIKIIKDTIK